MSDDETEVTIDEAVNAEGDVMGVMTIGKNKVEYSIEHGCIEGAAAKGWDAVKVLRKSIKKIMIDDLP